jgi:hypothetical protein
MGWPFARVAKQQLCVQGYCFFNERKNMIICRDGCYAYLGLTAAEALSAYMNADEDHNNLGPHELEWYSANKMTLTMTLTEAAKAAPEKTAARK